MRLTKIYTGKGDDGHTTINKHRIPKDDLLIEAMGTLDELNSFIGMIISLHILNKEIEAAYTQIQNDLFDLGGELYLAQHAIISPSHVTRLEKLIDAWNSTLPPLQEFLLPRGNLKSATTHVARTICRRAERHIVRLHRQTPLHNFEILRYLNRLSDVLFVAARLLSKETDEQEILWNPLKNK